ncbi:jg23114 [Pararge aegeria aegeria]|uniref:Jg23114 protein n=1 Tax=Pararge aegeria aegeria TaxID=348720 RepID=A0A8S4SAV1_9NEOP|nr:jg23114 [Pararge aegeria aegeria]
MEHARGQVYFSSRYRGLCVGTLVSRTAVITAAVCITDATHRAPDTRPINVVTGATYRHPRRGIRVQVNKILIPKLSNATGERAYMIQKSPAILLLARKVPDVLAEIPQRPIEVDYKGEEVLSLHEECLMAGWHFFYKGVSSKRIVTHKYQMSFFVCVWVAPWMF